MTATDLRFAVNFSPDVEVTGTAVVPGGTNLPTAVTGISITSGSQTITGPANWTAGITVGQRIQVAYKPADGGAAADGDLSGWLKAFDWYDSYVGTVSSTQINVTQSDLTTPRTAGYTYSNASPPTPTPLTPLTVHAWDSTVDPLPVANCLVRYGGWPVYCKNATDSEGTMIVQWQNFTSFNLRAVGDNNSTGSGITNLAISPGNALYFCDADVKDNIAGFGLGYLSRKKWGNFQAAQSMSNVASGTQAYVGAWLTYPPVPGGAQSTDIRNPYNETVLSSTTTPIANNGQVVGITVTGSYPGNVLALAAAPTISNASAGARLTIVNRDPVVTVRLFDESTSATAPPTGLGTHTATNLDLQATNRDLAPGGTITLVFAKDNTAAVNWQEVAYATASGGASINWDTPIAFLSAGSPTGDPFTTAGFLGVNSTVTLGASHGTLGNFLRVGETISFQTGTAGGMHSAISVAEKWITDPHSPSGLSYIADNWALVDSRQYIARGVVNATGINTNQYTMGFWHDRTYWGDLGAIWDLGQTFIDIGEQYDLTLKGNASLGARYCLKFNDITLTPITYAGATVTVTNCDSTSGQANLTAEAGSVTSPTTGRNQLGFSFLDSDVGKTLTHSGFTGTRTIQSVTGTDGLGNYRTAVLDANASSTTTATATIHDPSTTYTPNPPLGQTLILINPLTNAGAGTDDANRGIDTSAATFFGGNVYGYNISSGNLAANAVWSILNATGAGTFGAAGSGTTNQLNAISNTQTTFRMVRDAGNAATQAGVGIAAIPMQGTVGITGSSANWTTGASITAENDSNAAWSAGVAPGRLLLRTQVAAASGTKVGIAIDHLQAIHLGNYGTALNVINQSYVAIDSAGKTWFGPTAYTSGAPSAAPAHITNAGVITGASLTTGSGTITGGALTVTTGTFSGAITGVTALTMTGALTQGSSGQFTADASGNIVTTGSLNVNGGKLRVGDANVGTYFINTPALASNINAISLGNTTTDTANPTSNANMTISLWKGATNYYFMIKFNDGGTTRYKYLQLNGTGSTFTAGTSAPA